MPGQPVRVIKLNPMRVAAQAVGGIGDLAAVELIIGVGLSNHTGFVIDQLDLGRSALFDALTASKKAEIRWIQFRSLVCCVYKPDYLHTNIIFVHPFHQCLLA